MEEVKHPLLRELRADGGNLSYTASGLPFLLSHARATGSRFNAQEPYLRFSVVLDARIYDPKAKLKQPIVQANFILGQGGKHPLDAAALTVPMDAQSNAPGKGFTNFGARGSSVTWERMRDSTSPIGKAIDAFRAAFDARDPNVMLALQASLQRAAVRAEMAADKRDKNALEEAAGRNGRDPNPGEAERELKYAQNERALATQALDWAKDIGIRYLADSDAGRRAAERAAQEVARVLEAREQAATAGAAVVAEAKVRAEARAVALAQEKQRIERLQLAAEDMAKALRAVLATPEGREWMDHLKRGFGTNTEIGRAWASVRDALAKAEGKPTNA